MPNWKKVVVSGSDAALNSLNVATNVSASGNMTANTGSFNKVEVANEINSSLYLNKQVLTSDQTVPATFNGMLASPISVNTGINLTIETGATLIIL